MDFSKKDWLDKVSHVAQVGGIETSILDNGRGRGTRIAWVNTGTGLRFKVVIDRAMDISDAYFNQFNLSWISKLGVTGPQPFSDRGTDWLRTFGGGLLVTCGLTHVGGPETDAFGSRGLHDQISNIPAEIIHIKQPDLLNGDREMSITGKMLQGHALGHNIELIRTIRCYLGNPTLYIEDEVQNVGNSDAPHMLLYHFNFGWPLVDAGTQILWNGKWQPRESGESNKIFKEGNDFKICPEPREDHRGSGEEAAFISPISDDEGNCQCGLFNEKLNFAVMLTFKKEQLPWLTNWQHWGQGEYVTGLEPGTHPPLGQKQMRECKELVFLKPKEKKVYQLALTILDKQEAIQAFKNNMQNI
ncbi:aldose 1-epimerase family protein [Sphingobacterium faecium]|uniref:aldose 1-epimerase family protein n=1 Tax=Sphingobacterium faecium TaxID=34087 RepID=UPI002468A41B|nr:aldose 1-epimerase family protein [Sphingobacterium faecium]MDH5825581.1 aldose 1-epimerase family protein [Sphingobacterium faecium]